MTPIFDKAQAVDSGWEQLRKAMLSFEGDVIKVEFGEYPPTLNADGTQRGAREFMDVTCRNWKAITVTEVLNFFPEEFSFRVNCSSGKGSFWVDEFLESADRNRIILPNGLLGNRILWIRVDKPWTVKEKSGVTSGYVIDRVLGLAAPVVAAAVVPIPVAASITPAAVIAAVPTIAQVPVVTPIPVVGAPVVVASVTPVVAAPVVVPVTPVVVPVTPLPAEATVTDPLAIACDLAVNKTEEQFQAAIGLHPSFVGTPLLDLAKAGAITQTLVDSGRLKRAIDTAGQTVYIKG